jgi:hypothetical protein
MDTLLGCTEGIVGANRLPLPAVRVAGLVRMPSVRKERMTLTPESGSDLLTKVRGFFHHFVQALHDGAKRAI